MYQCCAAGQSLIPPHASADNLASKRARLADVVEVSVGRRFLGEEFLVRVELLVQTELLLQQHQPVVAQRLCRAHRADSQHPA